MEYTPHNNEGETKDPQTAPADAGAQVQSPADECPPGTTHDKYVKPDKQSVGEKWWQRYTYIVTGYALNLGVSLVIWDYFLTGKGRPALNKFAKGAGKLLQSTGMEAQKADKVAMVASEMACSPLGGHLTMIPVKYAEDNARFLTHRFNQLLDPNYQYKDLKADWNTPDSELPPLADEPTRNTWGELAMRRGLGWAAVTASGTALNKMGWDGPLQNRTEAVVLKGLSHVPGTEGLRANPTFQRYTKLAALDAYFTVITSMVTALTKQTFGKKHDNAVADDALSIDIPRVTESTNEKDAPIPAHCHVSKVTPAATSMAEKITARRQAAESETSTQLSA